MHPNSTNQPVLGPACTHQHITDSIVATVVARTDGQQQQNGTGTSGGENSQGKSPAVTPRIVTKTEPREEAEGHSDQGGAKQS